MKKRIGMKQVAKKKAMVPRVRNVTMELKKAQPKMAPMPVTAPEMEKAMQNPDRKVRQAIVQRMSGGSADFKAVNY